MAKTSKKAYVVSIPDREHAIFYVEARNHNGACEEAFKSLGGKALLIDPKNEEISIRKVVELAVGLKLSGKQIDDEVRRFRKNFGISKG